MRKTDEIKQDITNVRANIEKLQAEEKFDEATAEAKRLNDLCREYETAQAMENSDFKNFISTGIVSVATPTAQNSKKLLNRTFNKLVFGKVFGWTLTDEEKEIAKKIVNTAGTPGQVGATPAKGGYLIPTEQFAQLLEFRRAYTALKDFCTVRTASSRNGIQPTIGEESGKLISFDEINDINTDDIDFGQLAYSIATYGDIIPVANELLQDADVDLMTIIGQRFARKSINTENAKILALMETLTADTTGTTYKILLKALNTGLDPAISANSSIFTNQTGYDYLDELVDSQGRPLLTQSLADPQTYMFKGRKVVELKDSFLANDTTTTSGTTYAPFFIGSMSDFCHFFNRNEVEIAVSTEAGFTQNKTYVRAIERFHAVKADSDAMVWKKIAIAS